MTVDARDAAKLIVPDLARTLWPAFAEVAARLGDKPFLIEDGEPVILYSNLEPRTAALAARLRRLAGEPGERVLVQVKKSPEAILLYLAALRAGLIYVPLNTSYTAVERVDFAADAEPTLVVDDATLADLFDNPADASGPLMPSKPDDTACILYTSGTTGRSKGAMLTHGNLLSNALTLRDLWRWSADDVLLHILPIYHVHGLFVALHGALLAGASMIFHREFDPTAVIADLPRATVLMGVPTHYTRLLAAGISNEDCMDMRLFVSGSAPLLAADHRRFEAATGHAILERYGMTETGMIASNSYDGRRVPGTVGYPLPGVEARLNEADVLEVRGPNVFAGYWRNPEKTAEDLAPDGWFATGDIAKIAGDGRITLVGRAKDLIIAGGLNIYPKEIEEAIDAIPGIQESAVIGVPHPDLGEAVVALVVARNTAPDEKRILQRLAGLARFKQPRRVILVDSLPRNAMGKVQKAALREAYANLFV